MERTFNIRKLSVELEPEILDEIKLVAAGQDVLLKDLISTIFLEYLTQPNVVRSIRIAKEQLKAKQEKASDAEIIALLKVLTKKLESK